MKECGVKEVCMYWRDFAVSVRLHPEVLLRERQKSIPRYAFYLGSTHTKETVGHEDKIACYSV